MTRALSLLASLLVTACATVGRPDVPPAAKAELAPTGALRVALVAVNPLFVTQSTSPPATRVPVDSAARAFEDLDARGRTLVAVARSTQEVWLRAHLKAATLVSASSPAAALQILKERKVDGYASNTAAFADPSRQLPGTRVLPGSFIDTPIAMAVIKVRPAADAFAYEFIDQLKASGAIDEIIAREKLGPGVRAAR